MALMAKVMRFYTRSSVDLLIFHFPEHGGMKRTEIVDLEGGSFTDRRAMREAVDKALGVKSRMRFFIFSTHEAR
jgi:hypothetical protein